MSEKGFCFMSTRGFKGSRRALTSQITVFERSLYHSGEDREAEERKARVSKPRWEAVIIASCLPGTVHTVLHLVSFNPLKESSWFIIIEVRILPPREAK